MKGLGGVRDIIRQGAAYGLYVGLLNGIGIWDRRQVRRARPPRSGRPVAGAGSSSRRSRPWACFVGHNWPMHGVWRPKLVAGTTWEGGQGSAESRWRSHAAAPLTARWSAQPGMQRPGHLSRPHTRRVGALVRSAVDSAGRVVRIGVIVAAAPPPARRAKFAPDRMRSCT